VAELPMAVEDSEKLQFPIANNEKIVLVLFHSSMVDSIMRVLAASFLALKLYVVI
jgi:hypothetical protein